jgi:DNA gyrase subunit A
VVASFPAKIKDQLILITDAGKMIRVPVEGIRICGRQSQGVKLFRINEDEKVTSVAYLKEDQIEADENAEFEEEGVLEEPME